MSARSQVLSAFETVLQNGDPFWSIVIPSRLIPPRQIWPFVMVYSPGDTVEIDSINFDKIYSREIDVLVTVMLKVNDITKIESDMESASLEIEKRITENSIRSAGVKIQALKLVSTELSVVVTEDETIDHAEVLVTYKVLTANLESDPSTLI
jgi:hypothetical protein